LRSAVAWSPETDATRSMADVERRSGELGGLVAGYPRVALSGMSCCNTRTTRPPASLGQPGVVEGAGDAAGIRQRDDTMRVHAWRVSDALHHHRERTPHAEDGWSKFERGVRTVPVEGCGSPTNAQKNID
jgi:hypothetical protein